jgi:hypothetical protein
LLPVKKMDGRSDGSRLLSEAASGRAQEIAVEQSRLPDRRSHNYLTQLLMTVLFAVRTARVFSVLRRMRGMAMRGVGVMSSFLVMAGFMVLGCLGVMVRRARMMFRGFFMMFRSFARHYGSLTIVIRPARTVPTYCEARMTSRCLCVAISRKPCGQVTSNCSQQAFSHWFVPPLS